MTLVPGKRGRLIARTAPEHATDVDVRVDGEVIGRWHFERTDGFLEAAVDLPARTTPDARVTLTPISTDWVDHHVWAVQAP